MSATINCNSISGEEIRAVRVRLGWTQRQLSYSLGVAERTVSQWELGRVACKKQCYVDLLDKLRKKPVEK